MIMQAMVQVKLGRGDDAVTSCTEALEIDGDLVEALVQRGEAKLLVEDWEGAVADLRSAAEKSPRALLDSKGLGYVTFSEVLLLRKVLFDQHFQLPSIDFHLIEKA
ncbi:dnaJ protein P58IPK homolog A-like isoform X3 [Salvia miltiorrhiza]|uniref:dnaJ protein P58IPK homolog A-like isoform X3 n=1 Tax=Salvia miltiorrhiza TaxID=226208 RepID=UPI0025ACDE5E|nr:dnaJ protein P58IPK homolog A-like isoform X3 [Salvia miltiorrhiza]